ncbi:GntR family transcriptional regulator [Brevundimonas diminuta]|uniref:GntR family transcriptional regulator n=1 Tax=Brevundimonas diminuta TaxID=293 RepID=UPI0025A5D572|nr:GntR family transcriptional regulator [Brevundimonas diminuta]MDM8354286.1 GntR family transcriptional regulator [Brevundimonas diminuta]
MAKSRDPFFLALDRIRDRAQTGGYPAGRPIVIVEEARRLGVSTTPVREALSWLCGEGLIERGPAGGFLAVRLDSGAVRARYGFRLVCLLAGLDLTAGLPTYGRTPQRDGEPVSELHALFDELVQRTGNAVLRRAYDRVTGQLRQFEEAERHAFGDADGEADRILALAAADRNGELRAALRDYHDRRGDAAAILSLGAARLRPASGTSDPP